MRNRVICIRPVTVFLPLEEEEVQVVVVFGEEVAQDLVWVATFDLVGRQAEVDTLHKVPELSNRVPVEPPVGRKRHDEILKEKHSECALSCFMKKKHCLFNLVTILFYLIIKAIKTQFERK